jgi:threonine synthase
VKYLSTRGDRPRAASPTSCSRAWRRTAGCTCPRTTRRIDGATLARWRGLPYADLAFEILSLYIDDIPAADLKRAGAAHLHARGLRHAADHAAAALEDGVLI